MWIHKLQEKKWCVAAIRSCFGEMCILTEKSCTAREKLRTFLSWRLAWYLIWPLVCMYGYVKFFLFLLWIRANCRIFNLKFNCKLYIGNFLCIFFELLEFFPLVLFALKEHFSQSSCMYYINIIEAVYRFKPINIIVLNGIIDEKSE